MLRAGDLRGAEQWYVRSFERLIKAAASPATPPRVRLSSVQHLKYALAYLVEALNQRSADATEIAAVIERARSTALATFRVIEIANQDSRAARAAPASTGVLPTVRN